jgi:hypothetical protein
MEGKKREWIDDVREAIARYSKKNSEDFYQRTRGRPSHDKEDARYYTFLNKLLKPPSGVLSVPKII